MSQSPLHFKISELRHRSLIRTNEAILVVFSAIIAIAILPTILLRYMYDTTQLLEQPKLLEYIPVASLIIATLYVLRALIGNMKREKNVKNLMTELELMNDGCCGSKDECCSDEDSDWDEDLKELEELLAEVEAEEATSKKKKAAKKSTAKKVVKKTSKKSSKK